MRLPDRATNIRCGLAALLLALCPLMREVFARYRAVLFPGFRALWKQVIRVQAGLASVAPLALWDLCALVMIGYVVVRVGIALRRRRPVLPLLSWAALVASVTYFLFAGAWALNHYAPSLATELDLEVGQYSLDELAEATDHYLSRAAELAPQVPRTQDGQLERQDFFELARIAGESYTGLQESYPIFRGSQAPVKALLVWGPPLLYSGHTGIYWAATGEAGVPLDCAVADMPFIMCHEAAHRLAIASEQEANFAAFLACTDSADVRFAYSGYYQAFSYCFNALYRYDADRALQLLEDTAAGDLHEGVVLLWGDRLDTRAHYDAYEGPFEEVGTAVNDTYLRSYGVDAGVRSYGLVVDYLIAAWKRGA